MPLPIRVSTPTTRRRQELRQGETTTFASATSRPLNNRSGSWVSRGGSRRWPWTWLARQTHRRAVASGCWTAGEAEESAVPGLRPSPRSLGRLTVRPRTSSGRWRGCTVIGPQRPLQFELELVLLAVHLDLDLDPYVVGHTESQRRTAQIQLHLVPARQRFGNHHQPLRGLLPGQRLLVLDLQVRQDRLRKFVAGPGAATLQAVSGSPRNSASPESGEGHLRRSVPPGDEPAYFCVRPTDPDFSCRSRARPRAPG